MKRMRMRAINLKRSIRLKVLTENGYVINPSAVLVCIHPRRGGATPKAKHKKRRTRAARTHPPPWPSAGHERPLSSKGGWPLAVANSQSNPASSVLERIPLKCQSGISKRFFQSGFKNRAARLYDTTSMVLLKQGPLPASWTRRHQVL